MAYNLGGMANPTLPPEVVEALRRGNKIEAIKLLRKAAGLGLAEAKARAEAHAPGAAAGRPMSGNAAHAPLYPGGRRIPGLSPGEVPRTSSAPVAFIILIAAIVIGAWLYSTMTAPEPEVIPAATRVESRPAPRPAIDRGPVREPAKKTPPGNKPTGAK
ncbi:MAG: hypothetical protein ABI789_00200 [Usitatibacter sp.]